MKKLKIAIIFGLILGVISIFMFAFPLSKISYQYIETMPFTKEGFVDSNLLSNKEALVGENENVALYIDETTSYIKVVDKKSGEIWLSNPNIEDPWVKDPSKAITNTALYKQKSTLEVSYINEKGSIASENNYRRSIYHPASPLNDEGTRTFDIKYLDNAVQVLYYIKNLEIDYSYFPKYFDKTTLDNIIENDESLSTRQRTVLKSTYSGFDAKLDAYYILDHKNLSGNARTILYEVFYDLWGYTRDEILEWDEAFGYILDQENISVRFNFEVAIQISLLDNGIETKIIRNSIVDQPNARITEIVLYPLFGSAVSIKEELEDENDPDSIVITETEGYLVIPDGSGAIIEFNNGKFSQNSYRKRLYGNDLSRMPNKMPEQQQKINIPLFGMVKENGAFAAIITEGDAMAYINADISGRIDSYNKIYASFQLKESEAVVLGSGYNQYGINLWTKDIVRTDFAIQYQFLSGDENNYAGIANVYRNHLINDLGLVKTDDTNKTVLTTALLGAYDHKEFFLGIPYTKIDSLTTFNEAMIILNEIMDRGISNINVLYQGSINGGFANEISDRSKLEKVLGSKKDYQKLENYLDSKGIKIYHEVNFMTTDSYRRTFDQYRYTAKRIRGSQARNFNYHYPSRLPVDNIEINGVSRTSQFVINPLYYEAIYQKFNKSTSFSNISLPLMGSLLAGEYSYNETYYKQDALRIQENFLKQIDQNILLANALGFSLPYADYLIDMPTEATLYALIDYQVPLLQLVLSNLVDYTSDSLNLASDRSVRYQFLKAIETGSNIKYTLSYESSRELLNTDYNYYMSTHYINWLDDIENEVKELDRLGIHQGRLVNHEKIVNNVFKVTYSTGLEIIINYNSFDVNVNGTIIDALDYFVLKEGN